MSTSFKLFTDSGLTSELSGNLVFEESVDHTQLPADQVLYLGSNAASKKIEAASDPGTDQIAVSITDSAVGSGHEATEIKLALTEAGLDSATGGASLNLGVTINSGVANAVAIWIRSRDATSTAGTSTELGITTNAVNEYDQ